MLTPDICVIGAGSGGLSVAAAAAAFGVSVVLVERGRMGGDCLNYGCVPSKSLLAAARHAQAVRDASRFGVDAGEPRIDFARVHAHVRSVIAAIEPHDSAERFTALGVRVINAQARFLDGRTVEAGAETIRARRFVIAAGSSPLIPDVPGLDTVPFLTNETIFERAQGFGHLLVLGGGPVGVELAQAYRRLGVRVSLATHGRLLGREDLEMTLRVTERLRAEGVGVHEYVRVKKAEAGGNGVRLSFTGPDGAQATLEGTHLLVAAGRRPNTHGLGLQAAGITFDEEGITTTPGLRTSNPRVYAIGDVVKGAPRFTHAANHHAGLVVRSILFRLPVRARAERVPRVVYCEPEYAHIGLTENEAAANDLGPRMVRAAFRKNDRARADGDTDGRIKLVVGGRGRILGVTIVGPQAGELIHLWSLAMARGIRLSGLLSYVAPYPTLGETGKRAVYTYFSAATGNRMVRWIVKLLQALG